MALLIVGLILFLGVHSVRIVADGWRASTMARVGELPWKGGYAVLSLIGFVLIVYGYGAARLDGTLLYNPPVWTRHVAALLLIPAFILLVAAYVPGTRIKRAVGHPMVAGVKIWAFAHLLANGFLHDVILFGAFLAWAVANYVAARRRDRAAGVVYAVGPISRDVMAIVIGLAAYVVFVLWLHVWLIGVKPFG